MTKFWLFVAKNQKTFVEESRVLFLEPANSTSVIRRSLRGQSSHAQTIVDIEDKVLLSISVSTVTVSGVRHVRLRLQAFEPSESQKDKRSFWLTKTLSEVAVVASNL